VLVNNAAIGYDTWESTVDGDLVGAQRIFNTNVFGAWRLTQALLPLLRHSEHGRIINVSSEARSLARMGAGAPAYATSKAALNALTRVLAAELRRDRILVNAVCPGWVATGMGGPGGHRRQGSGVRALGGNARRRRLKRRLLSRRQAPALVKAAALKRFLGYAVRR
jgi:NAD(P)-dependent dehydrogenase (short-subunit alcohol dehydrogenase family)